MGMLISFFLLTIPILSRLPSTLLSVFQSGDVHPYSRDAAKLLVLFLGNFKLLLTNSPPFALLMVGAVLVFIYHLKTSLRTILSPAIRRVDSAHSQSFDFLSGAAFLCVMISAFIYTFVCVQLQEDINSWTLSLRNVGPSALFLPFLLLYCYRLNTVKQKASMVGANKTHKIWVIAGIGIIIWSIALNVHLRRRDMAQYQTVTQPTIERLERLSQPGKRIAFWDGSPGGLMGEASFHFWGNYRYAGSVYDNLLLQEFPKYTYLRLRDIKAIATIENHPVSGNTRKEKFFQAIKRSRLYTIARSIYHRLQGPLPYKKITEEIVTGESSEKTRISIIAFPESETVELGPITLEEMLTLVRSRFGPARMWKESIQKTRWVIISLEPKSK
jgi:hypothetical protein